MGVISFKKKSATISVNFIQVQKSALVWFSKSSHLYLHQNYSIFCVVFYNSDSCMKLRYSIFEVSDDELLWHKSTIFFFCYVTWHSFWCLGPPYRVTSVTSFLYNVSIFFYEQKSRQFLHCRQMWSKTTASIMFDVPCSSMQL